MSSIVNFSTLSDDDKETCLFAFCIDYLRHYQHVYNVFHSKQYDKIFGYFLHYNPLVDSSSFELRLPDNSNFTVSFINYCSVLDNKQLRLF